MKNLKEKFAGCKPDILILNSKLRLLVVSLLLIQLFLLVFTSLPNNQRMPQWNFSSSAQAQSGNESPVEVTEFDGGILIEWALPPEIVAELDSNEPFGPFIEAGWETELLNHIRLPAYTIPLWESPLAEGEIALTSEEILALVDVLASNPVTITIEAKTMPTQTLPSGDELPFISPLDPPESLAPTEPVYILREGMQRGERQFVIAVSPIYMDGDQIAVATKGAATLVGVLMKENQSRASQANEDSNGEITEDEVVLAEKVPTTDADQTEGETDTTSPTTSPLSSPLSSPLADPTDDRQGTPLNSPLPTPPASVVDQAEDDDTPDSSILAEQQPELSSPLAAPIDEAAQPTPLSDEPPLQSAPLQQPITPWSGLLTFAFFGLALIYILASGQN